MRISDAGSLGAIRNSRTFEDACSLPKIAADTCRPPFRRSRNRCNLTVELPSGDVPKSP